MRPAVGSRVKVPLGRGNRSVLGYCSAVGFKPTGGRKLKPIAEVLDAHPLLSPSMLRVTRWMADYYLCPWGQVLESVVPAGVRHRAGTRNVTMFSVAPEVAVKVNELELSAKQAEVMRHLASSPRPLSAVQLAARAKCTVAPINALREEGPAHGERRTAQRGAGGGGTRTARTGARTERRSTGGARRDSRFAPCGRASHDSDSWRHRQRQNGGLHPRDRGGRAIRSAGDSAWYRKSVSRRRR